MSHARGGLGPHWEPAWDTAPAWRFALPAGACGPDAVAGVILPSADAVGRRFPITLAALLPAGAAPPADAWFDALEAAAIAGRAGQADADALAAAIPLPGAPLPEPVFALPAMAEDLPAAMPGACPPEEALPPGGSEAPADVLGMLAAAAPLPDAAAAPSHDHATDAAHVPAHDDVLALLGAGATAEEPSTGAQGVATGDVLSAFIDPAPAAQSPDPLPEPDGTLALLIGAATPDATQAVPVAPVGEHPVAAPTDEDPLAALMREGAAPAPAPAQEWIAMEVASDPPPAPPLAPAERMGTAVAAPPAPEGGGWWTRGAAHVPPMVWALPALPAPEEFAYLLEAEA
jgi:type VI secretion system protein ImpM